MRRTLLGIGATAVVAAGVGLGIGAHRHAADSAALRHHGVVVTATVTGCSALLGGSGSNAAGYRCTGVFRLDGRRWTEVLPGNALRVPGSRERVVALPGAPGVLTVPGGDGRRPVSAPGG